ncbi:zeta toxin family protein [Pseudomonas sp. PD9R]|uniref:zeta toxin family protein n=1 Tax=Pseudomonas sp. PD9R TaxID=2853534 RepID=UPI001C44A213|nr:zeta toxin family protein [Pseudomonas sp. PD9R]MBV6823085.1 zeta toxin family protein [Pseudomonas sp. PD9R]
MSDITEYVYTPQDITKAFDEIAISLFSNIKVESTPKLLVTAGVEGSGKTYLLEKSLLPSGRYANYVRLYLPEYREKHPQYADMIKLGVLHAYKHTEAFVRELCGKIFANAVVRKCNIIMECAFDDIGFAGLAKFAPGYQLEAHIVGCSHAFAHLSSIKRALSSLEKQELERFVSYSALESSISNAPAVLVAFETIAKTMSGSQVFLYERGLGTLSERVLRAHSLYTLGVDGELTVTSTLEPYAYSAYDTILTRYVYSMPERDEMVKACHLALIKTERFAKQVPDFVYNDLYGYIIKYVYR